MKPSVITLLTLTVFLLSLSIESNGKATQIGFPSYDRAVLLESTSETSANVELGDINGDGNLDILLAKGRHWPLVNRVLIGNGKGGFLKSYDLSPDSERTYSSRLTDVDLDGDLDVVVSNDRPDRKRIYLNNGDGQFEIGSVFGRLEWSTRNVSTADLNNDGFPEIVVANRSGKRPGNNFICVNNGDGNFKKVIPFSDYSSTTITPADLNDDGLIDLVVPHRDGGQSYVYIQSAKGEFEFQKIPFGPRDATFRMSQAADFNGDGLVDIATIDTNRGVGLYLQGKNLGFSKISMSGKSSSRPYALAVSDLNKDGNVDIIVGHVKAHPVILFNKGDGKSFVPVKFGDDQGIVYGFAVGDINKDGELDIAAARSGAPNVLYMADSSASQNR